MEQVLAGPGTVLAGRYTIERELGRGGMATVYLAQDLRHRRPVAVKILRPEVAATLGSQRFLREIEIAARLTHPHILPLHDSGEAGELLYYVMPFIGGESLRDRIHREGRLPVESAIRIAREVADALSYAHAQGVVHRDIKPGNILLEAGHAVVSDFGIARAVTAAAGDEITTSGFAIGTPMYMSPEQVAGSRVDGRSDVYSLGCVLFEMLAGEPPFGGPSAQAVGAKHIKEPPPPLSQIRPDVPFSVSVALETALAKRPEDRFADAEGFAHALSVPAQEKPSGRLRRALGWSGLLAVTGLAVGMIVKERESNANQESAASGSSSAEPRLNPTHIAVLYFDTEGPDTSLRWVANGLTEDLIDQLGQVEALSVVSANGVRSYRNSPASPDSIAKALSVGTLVSGTVAGSLERPRITVRMIEPTGRQVASKAIAGTGGDILALRGELALQVGSFLRQRLGREIKLRQLQSAGNTGAWVQVRRAEDLREDAGILYAAGDTSGAQRTFTAADSLLEWAEQLDPDWPEPIVLRGWIAADRIKLADARTEVAIAKWGAQGLSFAERALSKEAGYPPALELRGTLRLDQWLYSNQARRSDVEAAERDLRAAAAPENPSSARAQSTLAYLLWWRGSFAEANLMARKAYEADAFLADAPGVLYQLYTTSLLLRRWDEASGWCGQGYRRFPGEWQFTLCRLNLLSMPTGKSPDVAQAWQLLAEMERVTAPSEWNALAPRWRMLVASVLARAGQPDSARRVLRAAQKAAGGDPELDIYEAEARVHLGEDERALSLLERYLAYSPALTALVRGYPSFDRLHRYPRFQALVADRQ
jgi:serine/threonine protein kinase